MSWGGGRCGHRTLPQRSNQNAAKLEYRETFRRQTALKGFMHSLKPENQLGFFTCARTFRPSKVLSIICSTEPFDSSNFPRNSLRPSQISRISRSKRKKHLHYPPPCPIPSTAWAGLRGGGMKGGRALDDAWNCLLRFNDQ